MSALTHGELFMVVFIVGLVVSARWWPRMGAAIFVRLSGATTSDERPDEPDEHGRM